MKKILLLVLCFSFTSAFANECDFTQEARKFMVKVDGGELLLRLDFSAANKVFISAQNGNLDKESIVFFRGQYSFKEEVILTNKYCVFTGINESKGQKLLAFKTGEGVYNGLGSRVLLKEAIEYGEVLKVLFE